MIINLATLVAFNLLVFILANRAIIPYIIKWLETKLNTNNIIYRVIERTYRANMKISIWLIGYIIILIYICIFIDLWGINKIRIVINMIIENIDNIFPK